MNYVTRKVVENILGRQLQDSRRFENESEDALRVVLVGTGSPLTDPTRGGNDVINIIH